MKNKIFAFLTAIIMGFVGVFSPFSAVALASGTSILERYIDFCAEHCPLSVLLKNFSAEDKFKETLI